MSLDRGQKALKDLTTLPERAVTGGNNRMKVLVCAHSVSPSRGSEPGVGWGYVKALARYHDLWVITKERFEAEVEDACREDPVMSEHVRFHYVKRVRFHKLERLGRPFYYWTYRKWHKDAYEVAVQLHEKVGFDLAHQLTMIGFREPGYMWKLDIPFVWGPVGGFGILPWRILPALGPYGMLYFAAKNVVNLLHMRFLRRPRIAAKEAGPGLISVMTSARDAIRKYWRFDSPVLSSVGPPPIAGELALRTRSPSGPLRIAWCGLHIPRKALQFLLKALAALPREVRWQLDILGEGPSTSWWKDLSSRLGVAKRCVWHGWVPRDRAIRTIAESHVFVLSSVWEGTPSVIAEALALGVPVVCLDLHGMSDMVTEDCGIKIRPETPKQIVEDLARAIARLWKHEDERREMGRKALERSQVFSWERKAKTVDRIYREVVRSQTQ